MVMNINVNNTHTNKRISEPLETIFNRGKWGFDDQKHYLANEYLPLPFYMARKSDEHNFNKSISANFHYNQQQVPVFT